MSIHDDDTCPHLVRANLLEAENASLKQSLRLRIEQNALAQIGFKMYQDNVDSGGLHKDRKDAIARLEAENARLKAKVDRLTKAGDELHAFLINYIVESRISSAYLNKLDDGWNAAKEGKPSA